MRVRVVGLTGQTHIQKSYSQQGLITIWNPTEKQQSELVEGQAYDVAGPRKPVSLLKMGEVPLSSEFDVAAFVIHVGMVHKSSQQKRQWGFVADGSILSHPHELSDALLAISFCSPSVDCDSIVPINYNLVGSTGL
ncbi:hypothetical protein L1987_21564 [Smallanthus sonchifolius]|uniref:Uncharacterized protein n=1 Tax=Smallanthus sonchifolius TaxID=185202 RepID=A0ACB9IVG6_9ASTR|nr:hypothetical protein L1987_21564 [Smallanthus sonchifolius]